MSCSSSCSYAHLAANKADVAGAPATHCTHDRADMDAYLSSDVMTMSPAAVTPAVSPLSKEKGLYSPPNFTLSLGPGESLCGREQPHSVWLSEKSSCFYNAVAALYVAE